MVTSFAALQLSNEQICKSICVKKFSIYNTCTYLQQVTHLWYRFKYGQWCLSFVIHITIQFEFIPRAGWNFKISFLNASISVKPEGHPGLMWGIWLFRRIFVKIPTVGPQNLVKSDQISPPWKWVVRGRVLQNLM